MPSHCEQYLSATRDFLIELLDEKERDFYSEALEPYSCENISSVKMIFPNQLDETGFYGLLLSSDIRENCVDSTTHFNYTLAKHLANENIQFAGERLDIKNLKVLQTDTFNSLLLVKGFLLIDSTNHLCVLTLRQ